MARRTIGLDELDHFELDDDGRLYWKGEQVVLEQRLNIPIAVNIAVIAGSAGAVASGIFAAMSYFSPTCL